MRKGWTEQGAARLVLATIVGLLVAGVIAVLLILRPSEPSDALGIIRKAEKDFAKAPAFSGRVIARQGTQGGGSGQYPDIVANIDVLHRSTPSEGVRLLYDSYRTQTFLDRPTPGSFQIVSNSSITYDAARRVMESTALGVAGVLDVAPNSGGIAFFGWRLGPWTRVCRDGESKVLADEQIAGRSARHVRCGDLSGALAKAGFPVGVGVGAWDFWIDAKTGVILKLRGQMGRPFPTFPDGGFEFETIRYRALASDAFEPKLPVGARDLNVERAAAVAAIEKLPSFRVAYAETGTPKDCGGPCTPTPGLVSYRDERAARFEEGAQPSTRNFTVFDGSRCSIYVADRRLYFDLTEDIPSGAPANASDCVMGALQRLFPALRPFWDVPGGTQVAWDAYESRVCRKGGTGTVAGRRARQLLCPIPMDAPPYPNREIWLDSETGMLLKDVALFGARLDVTRIELNPAFPSTTFAFDPPSGAALGAQEQDPLRLTRLSKGQAAPAWSTSTLDGRTLTVETLLGRPTLVVIAGCTVAIDGSEGCDLLPALQTVYEEWHGRANLVWAAQGSNASTPDEGKEIPGTALAMIRFIVANNGYRFTVAADIAGCDPSACHPGPIDQAWYQTSNGDCCPPRLYVTLDKTGKVADIRKDRQGAAQLREMLEAASR